MIIIEQYIKSKTINELECEDSLFISNDFVAVIDGSTSKSKSKFDGESPGRLASHLLTKALEDLPTKSNALDAIEFLTKSIYHYYKDNKLEEYFKINPIDRLTACIVVYSKYRNEIWLVGDCQCMIDKAHYTNKKLIDELLSNVRSMYLQTEVVLNKSVDFNNEDPGRKFISPLLERQSLFQNSNDHGEFSYGVIDGFEVAKNEIKIIKITKAKHVILASDGYPRLYSSLKQSEKFLSKLLKEDPFLFKEYKATKGLEKGNVSFDDRAFIKISIR